MSGFGWFALLWLACGGGEPVRAPATPSAESSVRPVPTARTPGDPRPDVVVVSLDTTRADMVDAGTMPRLSALAARGTRWEWAFAHAPTTASSHATVWTGRDTHGHRVPRNGHPLPAALDTFPGRLTAGGWETIGVVGASVLGAEAGFGRSFLVWDDALQHDRGRRHEARAAEVTDRALAQVARRAHPDAPLMLFVHYYDAHAPFDAPDPYGARFVDRAYMGPFDGSPSSTTALATALREGRAEAVDVAALRARYRGELSYVDAELARLLDGLRAHGVDEQDVLVVFGDHGESLGDAGAAQPIGHGADVDLYVTHVPLLAFGRGVPAGVVVPDTVGLRDVGPTVLALAGVDGPLGVGSALLRDGAPASGSAGTQQSPVFLEATQPSSAERAQGWPNLDFERGAVSEHHLLVSAPYVRQAPALYARAAGQPPADEPIVSSVLQQRLRDWDAAAAAPEAAEVSSDMDAALKALGYRE
jgi:arylsulfatase A-like enzyme